jgi:hypothetical protein
LTSCETMAYSFVNNGSNGSIVFINEDKTVNDLEQKFNNITIASVFTFSQPFKAAKWQMLLF